MQCYRCSSWPCTCHDHQTIIHGDCREVLPELDVSLVITDPPYGTGCAPRGGLQAGTIDSESANRPFWDRFDMSWIYHCEGAAIAAFCAIKDVFVLGNAMQANGLLIYAKTNPNPVGSSYEPCVTRGFGFCRGRQHVLAYNAFNGQCHPTQKPIEVMEWIVSLSPDGTVLDPFLGSGTTLRACKDLGRTGIGIEIEERYCEIAANRLRQEVLF